jgi:hypothetical protein
MIRRMMAVVGIGVVLLMALATPASAHETDLYYSDGQAWVRGHTSINVYDQVCYGNYPVFTQYYVSTIGGLIPYTLHAPCGGSASRNHYPQQITTYRLCVTNIGCTAWKNT